MDGGCVVAVVDVDIELIAASSAKRVRFPAFVVLGRAATWVRGLVNNFLRVSFACLGSREAALQLWNSQKTFYKTLTQVTAPPSTVTVALHNFSAKLQ